MQPNAGEFDGEQLVLFALADLMGSEPLSGSGFETETPTEVSDEEEFRS